MRHSVQYPLATVTLIQNYPIKCFYVGNDMVWRRKNPEDNTVTEDCLISFYPKIYYGEKKELLTSIQTSRCPIELKNSSSCTISDTQPKEYKIHCNTIQFNITLGEDAKETLLLNHNSTYSCRYHNSLNSSNV